MDNTRKFAHWVSEGRPDPDYTHYRKTYELTHASPRRPHSPPPLSRRIGQSVKSLLGRSYLVSAVYRRTKSDLGGSLMKGVVVLPAGDTVYLSVPSQQRLAQGLDRADTPDLRELLFGPLEEMRREVEAGGGTFLVALIPSKEEIYGSDAYPPTLRAIRELRTELETRNLPVLDTYDLFRRRGAEQPVFYSVDMHLNQNGNRILADTIADWVREQGIFDSPPATASASHQQVGLLPR